VRSNKLQVICRRSLGGAFLLSSLLPFAGCKSRYVEATVHNSTSGAVHVLEVDYPSASFGTETLAAGGDFHYRFKIQGDGQLKASWTDAQGNEVNIKGPVLKEGDQGSLVLMLKDGAAHAQWDVAMNR
jgi:hypothetical protein